MSTSTKLVVLALLIFALGFWPVPRNGLNIKPISLALQLLQVCLSRFPSSSPCAEAGRAHFTRFLYSSAQFAPEAAIKHL